jgi:hypothetical protein
MTDSTITRPAAPAWLNPDVLPPAEVLDSILEAIADFAAVVGEAHTFIYRRGAAIADYQRNESPGPDDVWHAIDDHRRPATPP